MNLQRYVQVISMRDGYVMRQDEQGDYVKYEYIAELEAKLKFTDDLKLGELKRINVQLRGKIEELEATIKNMQLVVNEYNDWIKYHDSAEGDFMSFIGKRISLAEMKKGE